MPTTENTYRVTVVAGGVDCGTYTVTAPREVLAKTRAMAACFQAADRGEAPASNFRSGAWVDHIVVPVATEAAAKAGDRTARKALIVERMKAEILEDAGHAVSSRGDTMPLFPESFSHLHDFVDANEYGGLCDDNDDFARPWNQDEADDLNEMQDAVDAWLKTRKAAGEGVSA